jgi:hypothetical protein
MIEGQAEEAVWMPYYTMRLTVISSFKAKIVVPVVEATDASGVRPAWLSCVTCGVVSCVWCRVLAIH